MRIEHEFSVPVPVDQAWHVLLDVERIAPCMPGAALTGTDGERFTGKVAVKLGPVNLTYQGNGHFVTRDEQRRVVVIQASGQDRRGAGTAAATVTATLHPDGEATRVEVVTDLNITGRAAQYGRGMIADVSAKLTGQFADCLARHLAESPAATLPATAAPSAAPEPASVPAATAAPSAAPEPATAARGTDAAAPAGGGRPARPAPPTPAALPVPAPGAVPKAGHEPTVLPAPVDGPPTPTARPAAAPPAPTMRSRATRPPAQATPPPVPGSPPAAPPPSPGALPAQATPQEVRPTDHPAGVFADDVPAAVDRGGYRRIDHPEPEPVDLLGVVGVPDRLRRATPYLAGALVGAALVWLAMRRRAR